MSLRKAAALFVFFDEEIQTGRRATPPVLIVLTEPAFAVLRNGDHSALIASAEAFALSLGAAVAFATLDATAAELRMLAKEAAASFTESTAFASTISEAAATVVSDSAAALEDGQAVVDGDDNDAEVV